MVARSKAARLLGLQVRIPPGAWMSVCCECCVLSGSVLSVQRSPAECGVSECDLSTNAVKTLVGAIKMEFVLQMVDSGHSCVLCMNSLIIPLLSLVKSEHSSVMYNLLSLFTQLLPLEAINVSCLKIS